MKAYHRLFLFLLASLAITVLLSPWLAISWDRFVNARPALEPYRYSFARIFDRCFLVTSILLFFPCRRFLRIGSAYQIGLAPRTHVASDVATGFFWAVASMALLVALMSIQGIYTPFFRLNFSESTKTIMNGLLSGLGVGLFEEIFFRGIFFKGMMDERKPIRAFFIVNLVYAASHFVHPENEFRLYDHDFWGGLRYLVASFKPFLNLSEVFPGIIGLFLIGLVLSYAVIRTPLEDRQGRVHPFGEDALVKSQSREFAAEVFVFGFHRNYVFATASCLRTRIAPKTSVKRLSFLASAWRSMDKSTASPIG